MSGFACVECGHKFRTVKAAERAGFGPDGCPKCGGSDIDLADEPKRAIMDTQQIVDLAEHNIDRSCSGLARSGAIARWNSARCFLAAGEVAAARWAAVESLIFSVGVHHPEFERARAAHRALSLNERSDRVS